MAKLVYMNAFTAKVEADAGIPEGMSAETFAATTQACIRGQWVRRRRRTTGDHRRQPDAARLLPRGVR